MHFQSAQETANALAGLDRDEDHPDPAEAMTVRVTDDPAIVAKWVLEVLSQISAYDDQAVSHLVVGFLKYVAGARLLNVEKTAMQISGLAHRRGEKIELSEEGKALLGAMTFSSAKSGADLDECREDHEPINATPGRREPFALLRFGDQSFEIADGDIEGKLVFRVDNKSENWLGLVNDRESGWDVIGAEMLTQTMDVFASYINQHVIRLQDDKVGSEAHVFEIDGIRWWVRLNGNDAEFTLDPKDGWMKIPASIQANSFRDLGIAAAQHFVPEFKKRIAPDVRAWVLRMAHAAAITPIMPAVA